MKWQNRVFCFTFQSKISATRSLDYPIFRLRRSNCSGSVSGRATVQGATQIKWRKPFKGILTLRHTFASSELSRTMKISQKISNVPLALEWIPRRNVFYYKSDKFFSIIFFNENPKQNLKIISMQKDPINFVYFKNEFLYLFPLHFTFIWLGKEINNSSIVHLVTITN